MDKKIIVPKNTNVKQFLIDEGYRFPCGGKGLCGKCQIISNDLEPTSRDRLFFSNEDVNKGLRLACDKKTSEETSIIPMLEKSAVLKGKLNDPSLFVLLTHRVLEIYLVANGEIIDSFIDNTPPLDKFVLRSKVGKEIIELFEKYSLATVEEIMLFGDYDYYLKMLDKEIELIGSIDAALFTLPAERVYFPEFIDKKVNYVNLYMLNLPEKACFLTNDFFILRNENIEIHEIRENKINVDLSFDVLDVEQLARKFNVSKEFFFTNLKMERSMYKYVDIDLAKEILKIQQTYRARMGYERLAQKTKLYKFI